MALSYTKEQLDKIHSIEVEILSEVIRVCNENNIAWFTVGGTTLGAVRHDGFIPWDDDIDIGMMRDDYEKFINIAPGCLKEGYVFQHFAVAKNTPTYFAKVRKDGTEFLEHSNKSIKMHHGVFIDIMPFDRVPEDVELRKKYNRNVIMHHQLYMAKTLWLSSKPALRSRKAFFRTFVRSCLHILLLPVPKKVVFNSMEKAIRKYNDANTKMISSRGRSVFECYESDVFPTEEHPFENIIVNIPKDSHKVLTTQYGNYMQLPPEHKRTSHAPLSLKL
ncbi:MAG: LicD family protein [Clostridia bacterium]|nr:LicD family protein [Clostridia bacterium]